MATESSTAPVVAAATQKKGRSLADLLDEQVKTGVVSKEDLAKPMWTTNNNNSRSSPNRGAGRSSDRDFSSRDGGDSLNWQQRELVGNNNRGSQQQRNNNRGDNKLFTSSQSAKNSDMPEWASANVGGAAKNESLNWQQQALISRDDSDPFTRLVRGENEYARE